MLKESLKFALNPMNTILLYFNEKAPSGLLSVRMIIFQAFLFAVIANPITGKDGKEHAYYIRDYLGGKTEIIYAFGEKVSKGKHDVESASKWDKMVRIKPTLKGLLFSPIYYIEAAMFHTVRFTNIERWHIWFVINWLSAFCWAFDFKNGKVKSSVL